MNGAGSSAEPPASPAASDPGASATPASAPGSGHDTRVPALQTVLVADDNEVNRRIADKLVQRIGFATELVADGQQALDAVASGRAFAAVLMDCHMPVMDGYQATRRIRQTEPGRNLPIVAMSASVMQADKDKCLAAGMDDFVTKPAKPDELERILRRLIPALAAPALTVPASVLDGGALEGLRELGRTTGTDVVRELIELYLSDAPDRIGRIDAALSRGDGDPVEREAHGLKASSGSLGAMKLHDLLGELETLAGQGSLQEARVKFAGVRHEFDRAVAELRGHLGRP